MELLPEFLSAEARELWAPQRGRIARVPHDIDPLHFYRDFVAASVPCIIEGATDGWAARGWAARGAADGGFGAAAGDGRCCSGSEGASGSGAEPACGLARMAALAGEAAATVNVTPTGHGDCVVECPLGAAKPSDGRASTLLAFVKPEERRMNFSAFLKMLHGDDGGDSGRPDVETGVPYISFQNDSLRDSTEFGGGGAAAPSLASQVRACAVPRFLAVPASARRCSR